MGNGKDSAARQLDGTTFTIVNLDAVNTLLSLASAKVAMNFKYAKTSGSKVRVDVREL